LKGKLNVKCNALLIFIGLWWAFKLSNEWCRRKNYKYRNRLTY
jgi:hypothetical protein